MPYIVLDPNTGEQWLDFTSANLTDPPDPSQVFQKTKAVLVVLEQYRAAAAAATAELADVTVHWRRLTDEVRLGLYRDNPTGRLPSKEMIEALAAEKDPAMRDAYVRLKVLAEERRSMIGLLEAEAKLTQTVNVQIRPTSGY